ncbi:MAG: flagellar biosynthesis protein FlhB [Syntrophomonadaceae bacterium]|nr:flagellar biosynthesis protein FlhB [Syntrophomonadaceae bacterium]
MADNKENIIKQAVALKYEPISDTAPVVVAKGKGLLADNIIKTAQANEVPIKEDNDLINYLMSLELYQEIPPELYPIVAEILAFIYRIDQSL